MLHPPKVGGIGHRHLGLTPGKSKAKKFCVFKHAHQQIPAHAIHITLIAGSFVFIQVTCASLTAGLFTPKQPDYLVVYQPQDGDSQLSQCVSVCVFSFVSDQSSTNQIVSFHRFNIYLDND